MNINLDSLSIILNVLMFAATVAMAYFSYRSIKNSEKFNKKENEAKIIVYPLGNTRIPYQVYGTSQQVIEDNRFRLVIRNYGKTVAKNLKIQVENDFNTKFNFYHKLLNGQIIKEFPPNLKYEIEFKLKMEQKKYFKILIEYDTIYGEHKQYDNFIDLNYIYEHDVSINEL
ncbi:hypothetical protein [Methanosphaera sp.]